MSGAPPGNRNACKEPDQAVLAKYRALLLAGKITRAKMARQLGVHRATTYRWIPGSQLRDLRISQTKGNRQSGRVDIQAKETP